MTSYQVFASDHIAIGELVGKGMKAVGTIKPGKQEKAFTQASYGAHVAEVGVNAVTGETWVRRMLGVFAAGRILNEKTARSQCFGGMGFGIGAALTEDLVHDGRTGQIVNHDLAEYHVPVNADVPQLEVVFLEERDIHANPIGGLGICGAGAAIANAIYAALGRATDRSIDHVGAPSPGSGSIVAPGGRSLRYWNSPRFARRSSRSRCRTRRKRH